MKVMYCQVAMCYTYIKCKGVSYPLNVCSRSQKTFPKTFTVQPLKRHSNRETAERKRRNAVCCSAVHCLAVRPFSARVPLPLFLRRGRTPSWSSETRFYTASAIAKAYHIECCQKEPSISALAFGRGAVICAYCE